MGHERRPVLIHYPISDDLTDGSTVEHCTCGEEFPSFAALLHHTHVETKQ